MPSSCVTGLRNTPKAKTLIEPEPTNRPHTLANTTHQRLPKTLPISLPVSDRQRLTCLVWQFCSRCSAFAQRFYRQARLNRCDEIGTMAGVLVEETNERQQRRRAGSLMTLADGPSTIEVNGIALDMDV